MSLLQSIPNWGYFILLGVSFLTGHVLAFRPDPGQRPARRTAGRWLSSLLLLAALLIVSNQRIGTILPAVALAALGGVLSGRSAPPAPPRRKAGAAGDAEPVAEGAEAPEVEAPEVEAPGTSPDGPVDAHEGPADRGG